jgi:hypothetical protein
MSKNIFKKHTNQLTARSNISEIRNRLLQLEDTQETNNSVYDDIPDEVKDRSERVNKKFDFVEKVKSIDVPAFIKASPEDFIYSINLLAEKWTRGPNPYSLYPFEPELLSYDWVRLETPDVTNGLNAKLKNIANLRRTLSTNDLITQISDWIALRAAYITLAIDKSTEEPDPPNATFRNTNLWYDEKDEQYRADLASGKIRAPTLTLSPQEKQAMAQQTAADRDEYRANQNRANNQMIDKTVNDLRNAEYFNTGQQDYLKQQLAQLMGKKF